jgi:hypothetical protein
MTEHKSVASEVEELATVERTAHHEDGVSVWFSGNTVPAAFTNQMLSQGYALEHVDATDSDLIGVFKSITEF